MTSEIKLKCKTCKSYTKIDNPIIKETKNNKFLLTGTCSVCNKPVKSFITAKYNDHLTDADRATLKTGGMISALPILATLILQKGVSQTPEPVKEGGHVEEPEAKAKVVEVEEPLPDKINKLTLDNNEKRILNLATSIASKHGLSMFIGNGLFLNEGNGLFGNGLFGNGLGKLKHKRINLLKLKKQHDDIMEKVKLYKSKDKTGGVIDPVSLIIAIISAIITLITTIVSVVQQQQAFAREDAEKERRDQEAKKADDEQKLYELKQMLKSYDVTLGELSEDADLPVRDYCLQQLKDATSKVSSMKRTILSKAKDFNKTPPDFVDYCMDIAGQYEW